ncbi:MAG: PKD domain-containing protein [Flavisolibacter sp.]
MRPRIVPLLFLSLFWTALTYAQSANFTANVTSGCAPLIVNFTDQSTGNPTGWSWDFGNGATSTLQNPSTTYFYEGSYNVRLTITTSRGTNTITRTQYISIYGKPNVNFKVSDSVGCYPFRAHFTDLSTAYAGTTNIGWLWDFGNGTQSTQQNPLNVYSNSGNYTITLKVTNNKGCYGVYSKPSYIKISGGIQSDFNLTQPNVCRPPYKVTFTNNSTGPGILKYLWNFGDGSTSTQQNPVHQFSSTGNYTVSLATTSSEGCSDTLVKAGLLNLQNISTHFTSPDSVCINNSVQFQNTSTPVPVGSTWVFGDGTKSNEFNPQKTYNSVSTYTVKLYNSYTYCTDSASRQIKILPRPSASYKADNTFKCKPPFTVNFQDLSSNAVGWHWDFGDGATSNLKNPSHTYTDFGQYTVLLIVTNKSGCTDTLVNTDYIKIIKPVVSFPGLPMKGCLPYPVNFNVDINTLDVITSYKWDFGDGSPNSSAHFPAHTYTTQGTYTVTLTITTSTGCTEVDSIPAAITVGTHPVVDFSASPVPNCAFDPVQFKDNSTANPNGINQWLWYFGDGSVSNSPNPSHKYSDTGYFSVMLVVTNNGCSDSLTKPNIVHVNPPIAKFGYVTDCDDKHKVTFTDQSIGATSLDWDFGDGSPVDHSTNPVHIFPAYGNYLITLNAHNGSCFYPTTLTVQLINANPDFIADTTTICKTRTISFIATALGGGVPDYNYTWDFGDGNNGRNKNASNTYNKSGYYDITLHALDYNNCFYTVVKNKYIRIKGPTADFTSTNSKGCKGLTADFTDLSKDDGENKINKWQWNFGDGSTPVLTTGNSKHFYIDSGSYAVKLVVSDTYGCSDSLSIPDFVVTSVPMANFVGDTLACPGSPVFFNNLSSAINYSVLWNFGDGRTSPTFSPTISYPDTGRYTIKLIITDQYGCPDSLIKPYYVTVRKPIAKFTLSDSISSCAPLQVNFTNTSQYYISSLWDLSGGISTITDPVQYYVTPGTYPISLVVTSTGGCSDTAYNQIRLFDTSGSRVSYGPLNGCKPLDVNVTTFSKGPVTFTWDFGDGNVVNNAADREVHTYHSFGDFIPKVIMTDPSGCVIPVAGLDTIHIIGANTKFGVDKKLFCDQGFVNFLDSTTYNDPLIQYTWDFGDGSTSNDHNPGHQYNAPGIYSVSLSTLSKNNCLDTFTLNNIIKVVQSPLVSIGGDSIACVNVFMQHVGLFDRQDTSAVQWTWQFPNGNSSSIQNPLSQQYGNAGQFIVTALATNSSGCMDTAYKNILIQPLPQVEMPSALTVQAGFPVTIPATYSANVISYLWMPETGLSCTTCAQPVAGPKFNTKYTVSFIDSNGCRNSAQIQVIVICKNANVFVPNTFSPNGDGMNDVFYVRGRGLDRVKSLRIFNRWGQVVFEQTNFPVNDATYGWNGTFKGNKPIPDVYVYQLEVFCENSQVIHFEGNVALIQ